MYMLKIFAHKKFYIFLLFVSMLLHWKNQNHTTRVNADTRDNDSNCDCDCDYDEGKGKDDKEDMDNRAQNEN